MPPKSRKRVKKTPEPSSESTSEPRPSNLKSSSLKRYNKGFANLPPELLSKIVADFPEILVDDILMNPTYIGEKVPAGDYKARFAVLRALSQTCYHLRDFYLPLLWERFEVCMISSGGGSWYREIGQKMERTSEGMLRSEHLWPYVRIVTVTLTRYKTDVVLPPFVKMLQLLPNVHTLQIPHAHSAMTTALKDAFKGSTFPSIRTVIMPNCAHEILRCCPGVESVTCNEDDGGKLVSALLEAGCSKLQADAIRMFSSFPSLRVIEIEQRGIVKNIDDIVKVAKETLQACIDYVPATKPKKKQKNQAGDGSAQDDLVDLYTEPRAVKVRRTHHYSYADRHKLPFTPLPVEVDEFPL
ncbi:hypothetical protein FRC09_008842 [Ceratobasidium sp. 395]|nr:hypothetical protein FRC09_008842 [Ceratobasidium sp. 395]